MTAGTVRPDRATHGSGGRRAPDPGLPLSRHLYELVRPWRACLVLIGGMVLAAAVLELVPPLVVRHVIDDILGRHRTAGLAGAAALYLGATIGVTALTSAFAYLAATVAQRSLKGLRVRLFGHLLVLPASYHDRTPVGDSISRATADVEAIDDLFSSSVATLLGELTRLLTVASAMAVLSPALAAAAALVVPPLVLVTRILRRRVRDAERATRIAVGGLNAQLAEDLSGVEVIRAFGRHATFHHRFRLALQRWLQASNRSVLFNAFYAPTLNLLAAMATALLLWLGARHAFGAAGVSVGTLTAFVLLFARFFTPLVNLGDEWQTVQAALAGAERVFAVLDLPTDLPPNLPAEKPGSTPGSEPRQVAAGRGRGRPDFPAVELDAVTFGYNPGRPVLHDLSLTVRPGEHLAIVGQTGAGKSSLLSLVAGLHTPWTGQVQLAGTDPRQLDDPTRRALLGYVPQAVTLFSGTVTDNITLGDPHLTFEQVRQAARITGADPFIAALPDGYATVLSDSARGSGTQLSAGQRQLIALSRALVTTPAVLLLDEATAVIDGASDEAFRAAVRERILPTGTAVLTVAHRIATARDADRVILLSGGRVIERGTPEALIAAGGQFADLAALEEDGADWQRTL
ncbi:ATP-binding cassette, subfamily B [Modestobacter sp. DSM 44400]|uniref:ABC transporter ATP-binding protein n=1 Tax=Modestobacter sp. DSM 44400 TaxID=1550230 RepID=UPI00089C44B7|nr:ABC transporter ATP-binding protein [Modestobacter sp. DSM 44400]SDY81345.1 ATP-binding cassette, subfamily B [Modestobacter sp. DSM 44400]